MPWPLERTCWRQFTAQQGDYNKSRTGLLNAIIIIIIIIVIKSTVHCLQQACARGISSVCEGMRCHRSQGARAHIDNSAI